jgi:hypothetical protein
MANTTRKPETPIEMTARCAKPSRVKVVRGQNPRQGESLDRDKDSTTANKQDPQDTWCRCCFGDLYAVLLCITGIAFFEHFYPHSFASRRQLGGMISPRVLVAQGAL